MTTKAGLSAARHPETASRVIDGEAVILRPMDNRIVSLNRTGTRIWELLEEPVSVDRIVATVCAEFEVPKETAERDVAAFLEVMEAKGLLRTGAS